MYVVIIITCEKIKGYLETMMKRCKTTFLLFLFFVFNVCADEIKNKEELIIEIKTYINQGDILDSDDKTRVKYFTEAAELSKNYIKLYEDDDRGYAYLAYSLGGIIKFASFSKKGELTRNVKNTAEKALTLNENNDTALYILGVINREAASLNGLTKMMAKPVLGDIIDDTSFEKALEYFSKALEIDNKNVQYLFELAKTYEKLKKFDKAKEIYNKILGFDIQTKKDEIYVGKAKKKLSKLS